MAIVTKSAPGRPATPTSWASWPDTEAAAASLSITTLDPRAGAPHGAPRLARPATAWRRSAAGRGRRPLGVNVAPVVPGLTDHEIPAILGPPPTAGPRARASHGAPPSPRGDGLFDDWLAQHYPDRRTRSSPASAPYAAASSTTPASASVSAAKVCSPSSSSSSSRPPAASSGSPSPPPSSPPRRSGGRAFSSGCSASHEAANAAASQRHELHAPAVDEVTPARPPAGGTAGAAAGSRRAPPMACPCDRAPGGRAPVERQAKSAIASSAVTAAPLAPASAPPPLCAAFTARRRAPPRAPTSPAGPSARRASPRRAPRAPLQR